jgi:hypothetical protein
MAAVAMVVGESDDLQLGFPSAYESNYAAKQKPQRAFPEYGGMDYSQWAGDDLQAQWHQQKLRDAQFMSGAKLQSTQLSNKRANQSPHGYYRMPKAVLGQRKFANPSFGAYLVSPGRENYASAPFHFTTAHAEHRAPLEPEETGAGHCCDTFRGGVLRSAAGQVHGHNMLLARVGQLNAIDEAKQQFDMMGMLQPGQTLPAQAPFVDSLQNLSTDVSAPITVNLGLQRVVDLLMGEDILNNQESGFRSADSVFSETRAVLSGVLATGVSATVSEMSDTLGLIQRIEGLLQATLESDSDDVYMDEYANKQAQATYITLQELYKKLNTYLTRMVASANLQPRDRETLARSLVKSLGFAKSLNVAQGRSREVLALAERSGTAQGRQDAINAGAMGQFDHDSDRREDTEHGSRPSGPSDAEWGDEQRAQFGWRSGEFYPTNGRSVGWFGADEGVVDYGESPEDALQDAREPLLTGNERAEYQSLRSRSLPSVRGTPTATSANTDAPIRAFFDPDTQAFNVSSIDKPGSRTQSRRGAPDEMPEGLQQKSSRGRNVVGLLKGLVAPSVAPSPELPGRSSLRAPPIESKGTNPRSPTATPAVGIPQSTADLPDDLKELERISAGLRAKGFYGVPQIYGTKQAPGSAGYKAYIRNVKSKIIEYTRGK